jgi:hypothetical protein
MYQLSSPLQVMFARRRDEIGSLAASAKNSATPEGMNDATGLLLQ